MHNHAAAALYEPPNLTAEAVADGDANFVSTVERSGRGVQQVTAELTNVPTAQKNSVNEGIHTGKSAHSTNH